MYRSHSTSSNMPLISTRLFQTSWKGALLSMVLVITAAHAQEPTASPAPQEGQKVDVDQIKKKYWARGKESEMGVVQNRLFSKAGKLHFGTFLGVTFVDPFLSVYPLGFSAG